MTSPDPLKRTTLSVSGKARDAVNAMQEKLTLLRGYKPYHSEVVIKGMEALEREMEAEK